ncbi:CDP-glycerol glycerophosphotransferase family protein [Glutamicibacter protophormiae]|uniref:CDP-glycerol glycerophosphotransferase family protein n=1 Tax=Glutamicibacter protophormiae TaxID=37930 RepID=UPI00331C3B30
MLQPTTLIDQVLRYRCTNDLNDWKKFITDPDERKTIFSEYAEQVPVHPSVIFYESMSGARMMDSPYSIFNSLITEYREQFQNNLHVWSVRSTDVIPDAARKIPNVIFIKRHTKEYLYYLARSKYVISNSTLPEYFVRRSEQKYLNTWHGIGYKTLGRTQASPLGAGLAVTNMMQSTHSISPCEFMTSIHLNGFSMAGNYSGQLAETGYPRIDTTLNITRARQMQIRREMGLKLDRKTVLYAPTWRGDSNAEPFDIDRLELDLKQMSDLGLNVIFMGHHIMMNQISSANFSDVIIPQSNSNTNELLSIVDIMITDYSSIFFDFLVTGKPIIHYLYDYDEYKQSRGLALEIDELPGFIAFTSEELRSRVSALNEHDYEETYKYKECRKKYCTYDEGDSTRKVVEWFFFDEKSNIKIVDPSSGKQTMIFWGGRLDDSKERENFLTKISEAAASEIYTVSVLFARNVLQYDDVADTLRKLGDQISVIARGGYAFGMTRAEISARSNKDTPEASALYDNIYRREYRRMFGDQRFDEVVTFKNLSFFWRELAKYSYK